MGHRLPPAVDRNDFLQAALDFVDLQFFAAAFFDRIPHLPARHDLTLLSSASQLMLIMLSSTPEGQFRLLTFGGPPITIGPGPNDTFFDRIERVVQGRTSTVTAPPKCFLSASYLCECCTRSRGEDESSLKSGEK